LTLREPTGKVLHSVEGSLLFTHFGLSGPAALDFSRHWLRWVLEHGGQRPIVQFGLREVASLQAADEWLMKQAAANPRKQVGGVLGELMPSRLARLIAPEGAVFSSLPKADRRRVAEYIAAMPLEVTGDRGYSFAETTAG